jgi:hypothetical protein
VRRAVISEVEEGEVEDERESKEVSWGFSMALEPGKLRMRKIL